MESVESSPPAGNFTFAGAAVLEQVVSSGADAGERAGPVDAPVLTQKLGEAALVQVCGEGGREGESAASVGGGARGSLIWFHLLVIHPRRQLSPLFTASC